jgi:putative FmdB family regulatory protein
MPIYEYRCEDCGVELEKLQRLADEPLRDCPECGQPALKRLISAAGFRLKGSGWYETDFKKDNRRNLAEGDKPKADAGADSKSEGKSEAKPAGDAKPAAAADAKPAAKPVDTAKSRPASTPSASA